MGRALVGQISAAFVFMPKRSTGGTRTHCLQLPLQRAELLRQLQHRLVLLANMPLEMGYFLLQTFNVFVQWVEWFFRQLSSVRVRARARVGNNRDKRSD